MSQTDSHRNPGNWKPLFLGSKPRLLNELTPLLKGRTAAPPNYDLKTLPSRAEVFQLFSKLDTNICFLDVTTDPDGAATLLPEFLKWNATLPIVAVLEKNSPDTILRFLRLGATEFIIHPFTAEQVDSALGKLSRALTGTNAPGKTGKVVCVMPAKGACGASTVACNLAYQFKRKGASKVLLADLDALTGTQSFLLKIKSTYSFLDVLTQPTEVDLDLWKSVVVSRQGIDVLLPPENLTEGLADMLDATPLLEYGRVNYDAVVVDASSVYGSWNVSQALLCDEILLVTTNELPALQATQRALAYLRSEKVGEHKIRVVVNRYDPQAGLNQETVATALNTEVYQVIPDDYDAVQKSLMEGKAIPATTGFGKGMTALGDRLADRWSSREPAARKNTSISGLLSLFSRTST